MNIVKTTQLLKLDEVQLAGLVAYLMMLHGEQEFKLTEEEATYFNIDEVINKLEISLYEDDSLIVKINNG